MYHYQLDRIIIKIYRIDYFLIRKSFVENIPCSCCGMNFKQEFTQGEFNRWFKLKFKKIDLNFTRK